MLADADIATIGMPRARARAINALARAIVDGVVCLEESIGLDETIELLRGLPGIGLWTAEYIAMRALAEPDAFPAGDLGVRRALERDGRMPSEREVRARGEGWRPWRAYAVMYLWTVPRKGPRKNNFGELAPRFAGDPRGPIERNRRRSKATPRIA